MTKTRISIAATVLAGTLWFSSCSTKDTSSSPSNSSPPAKTNSSVTPQDQPSLSVAFKTEKKSAKYDMEFGIGGFGLIDERTGDFTHNFTSIQSELEQLVQQSDKLDLSNKEALSAFGNRVGQQLKMTDRDTVILAIKAVPSGKVLFAGYLKPTGEGQFELRTK